MLYENLWVTQVCKHMHTPAAAVPTHGSDILSILSFTSHLIVHMYVNEVRVSYIIHSIKFNCDSGISKKWQNVYTHICIGKMVQQSDMY